MPEQRGASIEAATRAEDTLINLNVATADADGQFQILLSSAHETAQRYRQRLDSIEIEVNRAAAQTNLDNPTSAREFQQFLVNKQREILSVLTDAHGSSSTMATQMRTLDTKYQSSTGSEGSGSADPQTGDGTIHEASFGHNDAPLPLGPFDEVQKNPHWTDKNLFPTPPAAADVKQSTIGDCYLAATMGAIAHANPQWIKDRIHYDDQTGTFDVTLWNDHDWQHIPITQTDIATNRDHHGASWPDPAAPIWPSVLESAYAKLHSPGDDLGHALDYGIGQGGSAPEAMQALTGNRGVKIDPEHVWWTRQHIDQQITHALGNRQPVTVSSGPHGGPLQNSHTYVVEGITGTGSEAQLTLRNPWESNPNDPLNSLITVRLGDVIGSGLTGGFDSFGTHPLDEVNIGNLGR